VCSGQLSLASARQQEAANWIKAYKRYVSAGANARQRDLPRHGLTPGAHLRVGTAAICKTGYVARVRGASHRQRAAAFRRYRLKRFARGYKVDHLVPVQIGGSNAVANLWPQRYAAPWGVRAKDRLDVKLRTLVCSGQLSLASARQQEAANWIKAYKRYVSAPAASVVKPAPLTPAQPAPPAAPATPSPAPSGPAKAALTGTIRAAFYYPWFPQTWGIDQLKLRSNYLPTRGRYSTSAQTVRAQIADMQYANVRVGLASWFGPSSTTDSHWPALFQAAQGTGFSWAPYYESEGLSDPTPAAIASDLHYLRATYGGGPELAMMPGGRMLVFVYNTDDHDNAHGCATVTRWKQAKDILQQQYGEAVYVDLKLFAQYTTCPDSASIDGWHQYGPASPVQDVSRTAGDGAYAISPGFWKSGTPYGTAPFLARDRARWQSSIATMNASGAKWQLITTYNEWGEGTAIESSSGCGVQPPLGTYCDWSSGGSISDLITDLHNAPPH
jgi:hypothetical protein